MKMAVKLLLLVLLCLISFGSRFSDNIPDSLPDEFRQALTHNESSKRLAYDSVYSLPNIILPFLGGVLIDSVFGSSLGILLSCIIVGIGSTIVSSAGTITSIRGSEQAFAAAIFGWFLFGFGEVMYIGQQAFAAKYFGEHYFATVLGLTNSFGQIVSGMSFQVLPRIAQRMGFSYALWVATFACYLSILACVVLRRIDQNAIAQRALDDQFQTMDASAPLLEQELLTKKQSVYTGLKELFTKAFGLREWVYCMACLVLYMVSSQFFSIGNKVLQVEYHLSEVDASFLLSFPFMLEAILLPLFAYAVDVFGYALSWLIMCAVLLTVVHFLLFLAAAPPFVIIITFSIARTILSASLWPLIAYMFPHHLIATAYGFVISFQNFGLVIAPLIISRIVPNYKRIEVLLSFLGIIACILCSLLLFVDRAKGGILQMKREEMKMAVGVGGWRVAGPPADRSLQS